MPRLGELLVSEGLLTDEQVQAALRAQVMWGGRLGTNLVELGSLDLDALSDALGRQHSRPAALARHFQHVDSELQRMLTPAFADRYSAVPLCKLETGNVVVAVAGPLDGRGLGIIAEELDVTPAQVIQACAAELRIRYHLERVYDIPRGARFLRSRGPTVTAFPYAQKAPEVYDSTPDLAIPEADDDEAALRAPPTTPVYVPSLRSTTPSTPPLTRLKPEPAPPPMPAPAPPPDPAPAPPADLAIDIAPAAAAAPAPTATPARPPLPPLPKLPRVPPRAPYPPRAASPSSGPATKPIARELDELRPPRPPAATTPPDDGGGRDRRKYVRTLGESVEHGHDNKTLGRIAIRRVAITTEPRTTTVAESDSFLEATRGIKRAGDRDRVAELVMEAIDRFAPTCDAAMLLIVRGEVAIGWKGFVRNEAPPHEVAVPFDDQSSLVWLAMQNHTARRAASDLAPIDRLLLESLCRHEGDLVVVPVAIAGNVPCMIAIATACDAPIAAVEAVAAAAGGAFARLMRDASR